MEFVFRREWIIFGVIGLISIALISMTMRSKAKKVNHDPKQTNENDNRLGFEQLSRNNEISEEKLLYERMKKENDKKTLDAVAFVQQTIEQYT